MAALSTAFVIAGFSFFLLTFSLSDWVLYGKYHMLLTDKQINTFGLRCRVRGTNPLRYQGDSCLLTLQ